MNVAPDTWGELEFGKNKSDDFIKTKENKTLWETRSGQKMTKLKTDRDGVYTSDVFSRWTKAEGIEHKFTAPDSSAGPAEKKIDTIQKRARAMLNFAADSGGLPLSTYDYMWDEAMSYAMTVDWMMPTSSPATGGVSPWEFRTGETPPLKYLHPWGCKAIAHVINPGKFKNKGRLCMFLGLAKNGDDGYRLYDFSTKSVFHSRSVKFYENEFFGRAPRRHTDTAPGDLRDDEDSTPPSHSNKIWHWLPPEGVSKEEVEDFDYTPHHEEEEENDYEDPNSTRGARPRAQTQVFDPTGWDAAWRHDMAIANTMTASENGHEQLKLWKNSEHDTRPRLPAGMIPANDNIAMHSEEREQWKGAKNNERKSIRENGAMRKMKRSEVPKGRRPIKCKWVFDIKKNSDGSVERYKARLVAKGFLQREGLDFTDTFAPTPALASVRLVAALSLSLGFSVHHQDVKTAFLIPTLPPDQRVYMEAPPGDNMHPDECIELLKCLYGLRQSAFKWNEEIDSLLRRRNFVPIAGDSCVYIHRDKHQNIDCIIAVHVDDILISAGPLMMSAVKRTFAKEYEMKDLGVLSWYLGMKFTFAPDGSSVEISQKTFTEEILRQYRMDKANCVDTPAIQHSRPSKEGKKKPMKLDKQEEALDTWMNGHSYRGLIGSLQYLAAGTRPDISYAVGIAARAVASPSREDWKGCMRILKYLRGTLNHGLRYNKDEQLDITGWSDSDWAGCLDTRMSTSGYVFTFAGGAISWKCKRQSIVARSTAEAELVALDLAAREALWLRKLKIELGIGEGSNIKIHEDNEAAIAISAEHRRTQRTKHIDIQYFAISDDVLTGRLSVAPVASSENTADIFTKALGAVKFRKFRDQLGVVPVGQD